MMACANKTMTDPIINSRLLQETQTSNSTAAPEVTKVVFLSMDVNLLLMLIGSIIGLSIIFCICFCFVYKVCVTVVENDSDKVHKIAAADMRSAKIGLSMNPRSLHESNL